MQAVINESSSLVITSFSSHSKKSPFLFTLHCKYINFALFCDKGS